MSRKNSSQSGFSLLESVVGLGAGAILLVVATRFYKDSYRTYNLQEQVAERNQNAHYTVKKITEVLQQAGSDLPASGWDVITASGSPPIITVGSNPRGGVQFITSVAPAPPTNKIPVSDTANFSKATHVLVDYLAAGVATVKAPITNRIAGIAAGDPDTLVISPGLTTPLSVGDMVYAYRIDAYLVSGTNLILRPEGDATKDMVLAENIDSLGVTFKKTDATTATTWSNMRSAVLGVRARTAVRDPRIKADSGYHKIRMTMNLLLRNKI